MTILAFDGRTLAADRQSTDLGLKRTVTKIQRGPAGSLLGGSGDSAMCEALRVWYATGADPAAYPDKSKVANLLVITATGQIQLYDNGPVPTVFLDKCAAFGSGRDFAEAAMYLGKTAAEAVGVACHFDSSCGMGIDVLHLDSSDNAPAADAFRPQTGEQDGFPY